MRETVLSVTEKQSITDIICSLRQQPPVLSMGGFNTLFYRITRKHVSNKKLTKYDTHSIYSILNYRPVGV